MIPKFPDFAAVTIDLRSAVEQFTSQFEPYSDYNFTSLWAWDSNNERKVSILNDNLVVRFTDYSTGAPFLSFLGTNRVEKTARALIDFCRESNLSDTLKLMPETSIKDMRSSVMNIIEDRDNFDYIYAPSALSSMRGRSFNTTRKLAAKFLVQKPNSYVESVNMRTEAAYEKIRGVLEAWSLHKAEQGKESDFSHEQAAILRMFDMAKYHEFEVTGLFFDAQMHAFSIDELLPRGYAIGHFWKANTRHKGIFEYLMQAEARHLETLGVTEWNCEQDLGIETLRRSKLAYRPTRFLKKYIVSLG